MMVWSIPFALPRSAVPFAIVPLALALGGALAWPIACLVALRAAFTGDVRRMMIVYGIALGLDPQALMVGPFIAAMAIQRRVALRWVALAGLAFAATLIARAGLGDLAMPPLLLDLPLSRGAPNLWVLLQATPGIGALPLNGLAFVVPVGAAGAYTAWFAARRLYPSTMADAALLCALVMMVAMPATDQTMLIVTDVLALIAALTGRSNPSRWRVVGLVLGASVLALLPAPSAGQLAAIALLAATVLHARAVLMQAANDNPLMPRTA